MDEHAQRLAALIEELYSGWSETNDQVRQRNGHPPKAQVEAQLSYILDDLRTGLVTLQVSEGSYFARRPRRSEV